MLGLGLSRQAFAIFGVYVIPTTSEGLLGKIEGIAGAVARWLGSGADQPGEDELGWFMSQNDIPAGLVIGFSKGAATVSDWFGANGSSVPYVLIEPWSSSFNVTLIGLDGYATTTTVDLADPDINENGVQGARRVVPPYSCAGGTHCVHPELANEIIDMAFP